MTTYRGLFLPTLLGVVAVLPPASAFVLLKQTAALSVEARANAASDQAAIELAQSIRLSPDLEEDTRALGVKIPPPNWLEKHHPPTEARAAVASEKVATDSSNLQLQGHSLGGVRESKAIATPTPTPNLGAGETLVQQSQQVVEPQTTNPLPTEEPPANEVQPSLAGEAGKNEAPTAVQTDAQRVSAPTTAQAPVASGSVRILNPQPGTLSDRTTSLVIQYPAGTTVKIQVNGDTLDPETPTQIERDPSQNLVTQTWYNIRLYEGENKIVVQAGNEAPIELSLVVRNQAAKLTLQPTGDPRVRADGRSTVNLTGTVTDKDGQPIRGNMLVTLSSSAGRFIGADQDEDLPGFQVMARDGQFSADLQSALQAQKVRVRAAVDVPKAEADALIPEGRLPLRTFEDGLLGDVEVYTQVEFVPNLRPSLVSGVINLRIGPGDTDMWGSLRDFLNPDNQGYGVDLDAALFATGPVGEWLFTGAFNSDRALNQDCEGNNRIFGGLQFCERPYPVYGDSSTVEYITPSKDNFYVRFERPSRTPGAEPDYGMWGDYHTREFSRVSQLFTATSRALHGFKANYSFGSLQVTALFSPDVSGFKRDTIVPNGTSGFYYLSERLLEPGSENVYIELEESDRPGTVLERKQLSRGPDYEIDYDQGRLTFRRPIFATELNLGDTGTAGTGPVLVRRIVVTYQYEGGRDTNVYAARAQYNFNQSLNRPAFAGVTYWREDQGMRNFDLIGLDFYVPLGRTGRILGEYARSSNDFSRVSGTGQAFRIEANGSFTSWLGARAYYRTVSDDFLNNATTSFNPGQTRYGASIAAQLTSTTALEFQYDHERNFGRSIRRRDFLDELLDPGIEARRDERLDNSLRTISAGVRQRIGTADLSLSYVNRVGEDDRRDFDRDTNQLVARLNMPLLYRKDKDPNQEGIDAAVSRYSRGSPLLTFRALHEHNLGNSDRRYPTRTVLALDWAAMPGVTMRLAQEFIDGSVFGKDSITRLDTIAERQLFKDTTIVSRYSILSGYNSIVGEGALGIQSRLRIAPGLRLLLGYERVTSSDFGRTGAGRRFRQPYAVGLSAASLGIGEGNRFSVGLEYTDNPDFQASGRVEYSDGESGDDNLVITGSAAGKLSRSLTGLLRYYQANGANQRLDRISDSMNLRVGLAYRDPSDDKFNALFKYEFRHNAGETIDEVLRDLGVTETQHLFSLEGIYAPTWRWEFYGKYAFRINNDEFVNNTISLAQLRTTYRLGYRTDVAGEVRWIGGRAESDYNEWAWAAEFGYYVTPDLRLGLGYSFGSADDRDFSGFRSSGGPYFQLTFKVNELFGGFGRQRVVPRQQQENEIRPMRATLPVSMTPNSTSAQESKNNIQSANPLDLLIHTAPAGNDLSGTPTQELVDFSQAKFLDINELLETKLGSKLFEHH